MTIGGEIRRRLQLHEVLGVRAAATEQVLRWPREGGACEGQGACRPA